MIQVCFFGKIHLSPILPSGNTLFLVVSMMLEVMIIIAKIQYFIRAYMF